MFNPKEIDIQRLKHDLRLTASESLALKRLLRTTWTKPMADEQRALAELRRRITRLCILRAFMRGRHHHRKPPRDGFAPGAEWNPAEYHARMAERAAREYLIPSPAGEAAPAAIEEASR
jgi:hypothetical protein